jgi:hypothetical protein
MQCVCRGSATVGSTTRHSICRCTVGCSIQRAPWMGLRCTCSLWSPKPPHPPACMATPDGVKGQGSNGQFSRGQWVAAHAPDKHMQHPTGLHCSPSRTNMATLWEAVRSVLTCRISWFVCSAQLNRLGHASDGLPATVAAERDQPAGLQESLPPVGGCCPLVGGTAPRGGRPRACCARPAGCAPCG